MRYCLIVFSLFCGSAFGELDVSALNAALEKAKRKPFDAEPGAGIPSALTRYFECSAAPDDLTPNAWAALQFSVWRDEDRLRLLWWKCKDPDSRILVAAALFDVVGERALHEYKELKVHSLRFNPDETSKRLVELTIAFENVSKRVETIRKMIEPAQEE